VQVIVGRACAAALSQVQVIIGRTSAGDHCPHRVQVIIGRTGAGDRRPHMGSCSFTGAGDHRSHECR